ncbi:glycine zipper 2TM domain-containing protein [Phenylobacterium sp.]|uniref:glycine zipper 2TM domain-containing protein n=1 Tax=Phenylobacterium sp. TaxID=1871053 RepID=UPI00301D7325
MRYIPLWAGALAIGAALGGCASTGGGSRWADACQRDYERNRAAATAAGAVIGGAAGAAVARDDAVGAAVGAVAGGVIANQMARRDDPCGYGFSGYPHNGRYGRWDERQGYWRR